MYFVWSAVKKPSLSCNEVDVQLHLLNTAQVTDLTYETFHISCFLMEQRFDAMSLYSIFIYFDIERRSLGFKNQTEDLVSHWYPCMNWLYILLKNISLTSMHTYSAKA